MSRKSWFDSLFARSHRSAPCQRQSRLGFEPLEQRTLLTTLTVDIGDPTANDPGGQPVFPDSRGSRCGLARRQDQSTRRHLQSVCSQYGQLDDPRHSEPGGVPGNSKWDMSVKASGKRFLAACFHGDDNGNITTVIGKGELMIPLIRCLALITAFCGIIVVNASAVPFDSDDFLVAAFLSDEILVYDADFSFKGNLDTSFNGVVGLDLTPSGTLVAAGRDPGEIREYDASGTLVNSFQHTDLNEPVDLKVGPGGTRLYVGTQGVNSVREFDFSGTSIRTIGTGFYAGVAVLPGNVLWADSVRTSGIIDVFDITSGNLLSTISLDNGQVNAASMFYSTTSDTVLTTDTRSDSIFERDTTGGFIRQFTASGLDVPLGVTRGPNGNVYATSFNDDTLYRWQADGTFIDSVSLASNLDGPVGIVWAGNVAPDPIEIALDIRPGGSANPVNLKSKGVLPVAILGTDEFDVTKVDFDSLLFGDPLLIDNGGTAVSPLRSSLVDISGDGFLDLTLKFSTRDLVEFGALGSDTIEGILTGETFDGIPFAGMDSIRLVPPNGSHGNSLQISTVPEPTTSALALAALCLAMRRVRLGWVESTGDLLERKADCGLWIWDSQSTPEP